MHFDYIVIFRLSNLLGATYKINSIFFCVCCCCFLVVVFSLFFWGGGGGRVLKYIPASPV